MRTQTERKKEMKVFNIAGQETQACFVIPLGRYKISISNILPPASLLVSETNDNEEEDINHKIFGRVNEFPTAQNIALAIAYCNANS